MKRLSGVGMVALTFSLAASGAQRPAVLFVQHPALQWEMAGKLVEAGFEVDWSGALPDEGLLRRFNAVVLLQGGAYLDEKAQRALLRYVQEGGGLFISLWKGEHLDDWLGQFALLDQLEARLRPEVVRDPKTERGGMTPWGVVFARTEQVAPSPVSEGVRGIWYPVGGGIGGCSATLPFEVGEAWQVVLRGEASARSEPWEDAARGLPVERRTTSGIPSAPPLFALRSYGQGRIALCGINTSYHFSGGYARALEGIAIEAGWEGRPSDLLRLLINTLRWLSEPSLKAGTFGGAKTPQRLLQVPRLPQHPPIRWQELKFGPPPKTLRGVVGVQTHLSVGKGSVAEYAQRARSLGLDFVVFLEDFRRLPRERWEQLVRECREVTSAQFLAAPGFLFEDGYGNHYFAIGDRLRYPDDDLLDEQRRFSLIDPSLRQPGQVGAVLLDWMHNRNRMELTIGSWLHARNPCPYYEFRSYDAVALFTQDFRVRPPRLLDELGKGYLHLLNRGECLWPFAITLVDEPRQLEEMMRDWGKGGPKGRPYLNVFEARDALDLREQMSSWHPAMPPYSHLRYVSNGPRVLEWRFLGPRDYEAYDWFQPTYWRWRLRLVAESEAGLGEVLIYDGHEVVRHFYPQGAKRFEWEEDWNHGQQHNLIAWVRDAEGGQAITMELFDRPQPLLEEFMCGDRMNQLSYSMQRREDGTGAQSGFVFGMTPNKGPWNCEVPPVATFKPDSRLGGAVPGFDGAPGGDPCLFVQPSLRCNLGEENLRRSRMRTDRLLHSADVMMGYGESDGLYPEEVPALNVWHTLAPTTPTRFLEAQVRRTYFNLRPGLLSAIVVDVVVRLKESLRVQDLTLGTFARNAARRWYLRIAKGALLSSETTPDALKGWQVFRLEGDAYVAFCGSPLGSVALFNLGPQPLEVHAQKDSGAWAIRFPVAGQELRAGTTMEAHLVAFGAPFTVEPDEWWLETVRQAMGFAGEPAYPLKVEAGKVLSQRYILRVDGKGQGFAARLGRADLPLTLPIVVEGLNPRWSVFLLERHRQRARPIGQWEGTAYATVDLREGDLDLFIGHPVVASDPEVFLNAVQTGEREFTVTVHNPMPKPKAVVVRSLSMWNLGRLAPQRVLLGPGGWKSLTLR